MLEVKPSDWLAARLSWIDVGRLLRHAYYLQFAPLMDARLSLNATPFMGMIVAHSVRAESDHLNELKQRRYVPPDVRLLQFTLTLDRGEISVIAASFILHRLYTAAVDPEFVPAGRRGQGSLKP